MNTCLTDTPIITTLADIDAYKASMGNFILKNYPGTKVKFAFKNRTKKVRLADLIDEGELREQLDHVKTLRFTRNDVDFIGNMHGNVSGRILFHDDYKNHLLQMRMPDYHLEKTADGQFDLDFLDNWEDVTYWETISLSIKNELASRKIFAQEYGTTNMEKAYEIGRERLLAKIARIKQYPGLRFMEFGTRRRFSRVWQDQLVEILMEHLPAGHLAGTSNLNLARKYKITPIGTMAHELFMVLAGLMSDTDEKLRSSHGLLLRQWYEMYAPDLLIALTDTFGTDFFYKDFTQEQHELWTGQRQDSGDPTSFGKRQVNIYQKYRIDSKKKLFVPSDGLDLDKMISLFKTFGETIGVLDGLGTSLTNDCGIHTLSMVVKAVEANGNGLVKLSDNIAKATGSPENIARYSRVFGYTNTNSEECVR